jgi:hypothetical protein
VIQQDSRYPTSHKQNGLPLKETEAIAMKGRGTNVLDPWTLKSRYLVPEVGGSYSGER